MTEAQERRRAAFDLAIQRRALPDNRALSSVGARLDGAGRPKISTLIEEAAEIEEYLLGGLAGVQRAALERLREREAATSLDGCAPGTTAATRDWLMGERS